MKTFNNYLIERLILNKNSKIRNEIEFNDFIRLMKSSKNNKFTYINSIKCIDKLQVNNWYKWDIFDNTYIYVIKNRNNVVQVVVIQENEKNHGYINIYIANANQNIKDNNQLYYFDCFFKNSSIGVIIKKIEWINEFLKILTILVKDQAEYGTNIRWSKDFKDFEKNFLTDEYLQFSRN